MEEKKELQTLLEGLEKTSQQQLRCAKLQCLFTGVAAACCLVVLVLLVCFLPQFSALVSRAEIILTNAEQFTQALAQANIQTLIANLEDVTTQLAQADLSSIAQDVSALVQSSQSGIQEAIAKLKALDLDTLNRAIADFAAVIKPLADFLGKF